MRGGKRVVQVRVGWCNRKVQGGPLGEQTNLCSIDWRKHASEGSCFQRVCC